MSKKTAVAADTPLDCPRCRKRAWITVGMGNHWVCCLTQGCAGQTMAGIAKRKPYAIREWNRNVAAIARATGKA